MKYLYDDEEDQDDLYPPVIIEINDEKMFELYEEVKKSTQK